MTNEEKEAEIKMIRSIILDSYYKNPRETEERILMFRQKMREKYTDYLRYQCYHLLTNCVYPYYANKFDLPKNEVRRFVYSLLTHADS